MKFKSKMAEGVYRSKYMIEGDKELIDPLKRIDKVVSKFYPHLEGKAIEYGTKKWIGFAGGLYRSAMNPNKKVSAINCTTLYNPKDDLESIADAWYWWAKFAASGQGEGADLSNLRPAGAIVHNSSSTSTGVISFMRTFDGILKEIAQNGRRGASLIALNISHPDIPEFIRCKDEEGILETANISIKITDDFMKAVKKDKDWEFVFTNEFQTIKQKTSARSLFRTIAEHAWKTGDPGLLFWDTSVLYSNSDYLGELIECCNACFAYDTLILTKDGYVKIGSLDGKTTELIDENNEVKKGKVWKSGEKETVTLTFYNREGELVCTPDHVFKLNDGSECEAKDLRGKRLMPFIELNEKNDLSDELMEIMTNRVKEVKPNGIVPVYDFQLEGDNHWGVVEGSISHNCSEQVLDGHSTCILSSINLAKYDEYGDEGYKELTHFLTFALDAFRLQEIDEDRSPSKEQIRKMIEMPRIGAGVTGLADFFIWHKLPYDSIEALEITEKLFGTLSGEAYKASYDIAKNYHKKSFPKYNKEVYKKAPFVANLLKNGYIEDYHLDYQAHVCNTTVAPNGSVSLIVEAGGSGVEPIFAKYFVRRERATTGDWKEWFMFNDLVEQYCLANGIELTKENVDKLNPEIFKTAHTIDNMKKIDLISTIQKYIDSAVSITYNLPEDCSVEDVEKIYMTAWEKGCKGVTVYREGSKAGVLITDANYEEKKEAEKIVYKDGVAKRPKEIVCDIHEISYQKEKYILLVGILNGFPYEIFVTKNIDNEFDFQKHKTGIITKSKKGVYSLDLVNGEKIRYLNDIVSSFDTVYGTLGRFISMSLRHQVSLQFIVDQLSKDKNFLGFERTVARVLKKYIKDGEAVKTNKTCDNCGSSHLVYSEGCLMCADCNSSKCS